MATSQATADYIVEQIQSLGQVITRKMFGEYALYYKEKVVALICNDCLFVKVTEQGRVFAGDYYQEGIAYPGAKPSIQIDEERLQDSTWLCQLIEITSQNLPVKKSKKTRNN